LSLVSVQLTSLSCLATDWNDAYVPFAFDADLTPIKSLVSVREFLLFTQRKLPGNPDS